MLHLLVWWQAVFYLICPKNHAVHVRESLPLGRHLLEAGFNKRVVETSVRHLDLIQNLSMVQAATIYFLTFKRYRSIVFISVVNCLKSLWIAAVVWIDRLQGTLLNEQRWLLFNPKPNLTILLGYLRRGEDEGINLHWGHYNAHFRHIGAGVSVY